MYDCSECGNSYSVPKKKVDSKWDEYSDCPKCGRKAYHGPGDA